MALKAKCKDCSWKAKSKGSVFLYVAMHAHRDATGHKVKLK